jgi:hypothetical protein
VSETPLLDKLMATEALVEPGAKMWVTSTVWAALALEVGGTKGDHPTPAPGEFTSLKFRKLTVINSGSEDEEMCHRLNRGDAERSGFQWKREHWRTG